MVKSLEIFDQVCGYLCSSNGLGRSERNHWDFRSRPYSLTFFESQGSNFNSLSLSNCKNWDNNIQFSRLLWGWDDNRVYEELRQTWPRGTAPDSRGIPILFSRLPQSCSLRLHFCCLSYKHGRIAWNAFHLLRVGKPTELSRRGGVVRTGVLESARSAFSSWSYLNCKPTFSQL